MGDIGARLDAVISALQEQNLLPRTEESTETQAARAVLQQQENHQRKERFRSEAARRTGDDNPQATAYSLGDPNELPHFPANPVPRPPSAVTGELFDIRLSSWGQNLQRQLGDRSGYFLELANWAPVASFLYDATSTLIALLGAEGTPAEVTASLEGIALSFTKITDLALNLIRIQQFRADSGPLAASAFQTKLQLEGSKGSFVPEAAEQFITEFVKRAQTAAHKRAADNHSFLPYHNSRAPRGRAPVRNFRGRGGRFFSGANTTALGPRPFPGPGRGGPPPPSSSA